jgi:cytochrome d ubiquinol oxidase subunit I
VQVPWLLGLIATRSLDGEVRGIKDLVADNRTRIEHGMLAYRAMRTLRADRTDAAARAVFDANAADLGYALLLKRSAPNVLDATPAQIDAAAWDTVPAVAPLFWSFRLMVGLGFYFIALFATMFVLASRRMVERYRWLLRLAAWSLPLPWVALELGWYVAEGGRQPWTIDGVLPTFLSVSDLPASSVAFSLAAFVLFYSALLVVELFLMVRTIRSGPAPHRDPTAAAA